MAYMTQAVLEHYQAGALAQIEHCQQRMERGDVYIAGLSAAKAAEFMTDYAAVAQSREGAEHMLDITAP